MEKIILFTDLHSEIIDNPQARINQIKQAILKEQPDYIINLGDFGYFCSTGEVSHPGKTMPINYNILNDEKTTKYKLLAEELYNQLEKLDVPIYSVLGNHDMDFCTKQRALEFYKLEQSYYHVETPTYILVFLDTNYFKNQKGELQDYSQGNYYHEDNTYLTPEQLTWLRDLFTRYNKPFILFSHAPLNDMPRGIKNHADLQKILLEAQNNGKKIVASLNGHLHIDVATEVHNITYVNVNSVSYHWMGTENKYYNEQILTPEHPVLQYILRYEEPLFCTLVLEEQGIRIFGKASEYGIEKDTYLAQEKVIVPKISHRFIAMP